MLLFIAFTLSGCNQGGDKKESNLAVEAVAEEANSAVEQMLTPFVIKEAAQVGVNNYPVSMVFPVEYGKYYTVSDFHIKNNLGEVVPAQFEVINRWWGKDNSIRHVQALFNTNSPAYQQGEESSGFTQYQLYYGNLNTLPTNPTSIAEINNSITLSNNLINIEIEKQPLVINTPAGKLTSIFQKENGDFDNSFNHENIKIEVEERGPLRTVLKISSQTEYINPTEIKHGWALRLYMHANSSLVKMEFQLQNSAINTDYSAPFYFKAHHLRFDAIDATNMVSLRADKLMSTEIESATSGVVSSKNINVFFKDFWQTFPNGLSIKENNKLDIELWPDWSSQFLDDHFVGNQLYWLDDMKHTYKELLLDFSGKDSPEYLLSVSKTFQYSPVAVIPQDYYAQTKVTLELGGYFPVSTPPTEINRLPEYSVTDFNVQSFGAYKFGMNNFAIDGSRKLRTTNTGGWPYSKRKFYVSANPIDYYAAQNMAKAEINIRPQWLSGYQHNSHFSIVKPSTNPYGGTSWRKFINHNSPILTRKYIEGTRQIANPRDDQHAWFYHVEQAYLMSGNKWLKDWFVFMAQFKQVYLNELDPWPDRSNRAEGHALNVALAAYRVTGNQQLGILLSKYVESVHSKYLLPPHNISVGRLNIENPTAAVFQQGFLVKAFINLYEEFDNQDITLAVIKNYVDWNFQYANFSYYRSILDFAVSTKASGSSLSFVDAAIWYDIRLGNTKYAEHAINFVQNGVGGNKAYGTWSTWQGQYESQLYNYYLQQIQ